MTIPGSSDRYTKQQVLRKLCSSWWASSKAVRGSVSSPLESLKRLAVSRTPPDSTAICRDRLACSRPARPARSTVPTRQSIAFVQTPRRASSATAGQNKARPSSRPDRPP
ncbi:hypothetical protein Micbo1qcDRAFT_37524 [Microdochium bolleyi]|uniref:Uncharacterized protein n=1 Tax=Microdochium bolleyi TaxID=196109 RepID=A0A136ILS4_9PEZI|nr:hypothetical protein Micbo1qcDRAFT_37524 [Microdochium bolleyi]